MRPSIFFLLTLFQLTALSFSSEQQVHPLCRDDERLALMQFKESFIIDKRASIAAGPSAYSKVDRWKFEGVDCCSWDGIECDHNTGHVIGLDLSGSCLYGSIDSSSSLFQLLHLQKLNLAFNDFNYSVIPSALGNLSMLTYLNLSGSVFSGQIPSEISKLFRLSSLDLSYNQDYSFEGLLELKMPDMKTLIRNLTNLKYLDLSYVDVASSIPSVLLNISSLRSLYLEHCGLLGEFPIAIFQLPNLQTLWLKNNSCLTGYFPEFNFTSQLKVIALAITNFSGELPASIGNLNSLEILRIGSCNFTGLVPSTLANLTMLKHLILKNNNFRGELPAKIGNLISLEHLDINYCNFTGLVPTMLGNLTKLNYLDIGENFFRGPIPSELMNLAQLTSLNLEENMLQGPIPKSISRLKKLEFFDSAANQLSGILELDTFLELKHLKYLLLSNNKWSSVISRNNTNATSPQLVDLALSSCNLRGFPHFLRNQHQLQFLDLASNNIGSQIPKWMSEVSIRTLLLLDLSNNSLTGFEDFPVLLPWSKLSYLGLDSNILRGSLPVPPFSTIFYSVSNNFLTGKIPKLLCNQSSLSSLDISNNNLSGEIPQCLSNFSKSLLVLKVGANNFHGPIPSTWASENKLKMIDLGKNKLQGKIPRSLMECGMLEYLNLGNNQISDAFPSWLGALPELNVLLLSSNALYGIIGDPDQTDFVFPKLRIVDLSHNRFNGALPSGYFERWNAMRSLDVRNSSASYMREYSPIIVNAMEVSWVYTYSMTITNKGIKMEYPQIIQTFFAIDLSCNRFDGGIPKSIGNLKALQLLNLSNNNLVGRIPLAIGKLTNLEALDLSQNKLAGRIPWQLTQLNFLEVFDVSHNHLTGRIPQGQQFDTFENSSFEGNLGLCGKPLLKECENSRASPPPPSSTSEDSGLLDELHWKVVLLGYGCAFPVGIVIGHLVTTRKHGWFAIAKTRSKSQRRWRKG